MRYPEQTINRNDRMHVLIMLYCIAFVGVFAVDFYLPAIPTIAAEFHSAPKMIGLTMSSYTLAFALGHLIVGPASDHLGRKKIFEIALLISIAGTFFCMLSCNFLELFVARGIQGFGLSCFVLTNAIIRDFFSNEIAVRIRISRNLLAYFLIAVAPSIGVAVLTIFDWRMIFALFLILSILIYGYIKFFGVETNVHINNDFNLGEKLRQFFKILMHRRFLLFSKIITLAYSVHFSFITISSNYLLIKMHISEKLYSGMMFGYGLSFLVSTVFALQLAKRISMMHLLQVGAIALVIGGVILISSTFVNEMTLSYLSIAVIVCIFGISFVVPSAMTLAMTEFETQAGSASACLGVMQFMIASLLGAIINMAYGYSIILIGVLAIIAGLLAKFWR